MSSFKNNNNNVHNKCNDKYLLFLPSKCVFFSFAVDLDLTKTCIAMNLFEITISKKFSICRFGILEDGRNVN